MAIHSHVASKPQEKYNTTIKQAIISSGNNHTGNISIMSTLFIETTGEAFAGQRAYTVFCLLRQDPEDLVVQGEINAIRVFSSELVIEPGTYNIIGKPPVVLLIM